MKRLMGFVIFGMVAVSFVGADFANAAAITVDTTNMTNQADGNGVPSECSLPDALAAADTNTAVNGCAAGDPASVAVDVVTIPSGTYDVTQMVSPMLQILSESTTIQGAGVSVTTLIGAGISIQPTSTSITAIALSNLTLSGNSTVIIFMNTAVAAASFDLHDSGLDGSQVIISHDGEYILTSTLSNIIGINGSSLNISNQSATTPGDTTISNVSLSGNGSSDAAITHLNVLGNDKVYVKDSTITDFSVGVYNSECARNSVAIGSVYISNSSIGGGNMSVGAENICGHLSADSTTFHDIHGAAIQAQTNHMGVDDLFGVQTCHPSQEGSRIELTNNTFTAINVASVGTTPPAVVSLDSTLNPMCPAQSLTTATTLLMQQNTFSNNTLGTFSDVSITDATILSGLTVQNNAFEGSSVAGDFTVSGTTAAINNLSTTAFSGPAFLRSAFRQVASFLLAPLANNGGTAKIGYHQTGGNALTFLPLWGSPLIDGTSDVGIETDQRGQSRSLLRTYDVGSVEITRGEVLGQGITVAALNAYLAAAQLANTGTSMYVCIGIALLASVVGSLLLVKRYSHKMSF